MYQTVPPPPLSADEARRQYAVFLRDIPRFTAALARVLDEWPISCEQFLTNEQSNRIAWLGQASMCIATRVPSVFRAGFMLLSNGDRVHANATALEWLHIWLRRRGESMPTVLALGMDTPDEPPEYLATPRGVHQKTAVYLEQWKQRGYPEDIPEEVPPLLSSYRLAPSYRAICVAILRNDVGLTSLGFAPRHSAWYDTLKRVELSQREPAASPQLSLPLR